VLGCPWYAEPPQAGFGVAARPFTAVPAANVSTLHMSSAHTSCVPMTAIPGSTESTRSFINDHKIGRPRVPGGPTG
jgi:hypothetical protein